MNIALITIDQILGTNDTNRRCAVYQNLHQHLRASVTKNLQLNSNSVRNLATIIGNDCVLKNGQISNSAWDLLEFILNFRVFDEEGELVFLDSLMGGDVNEIIKQLVLNVLKQRIALATNEGARVSTQVKDEILFKMFLPVIDDVCNDLSKDISAKFLVNKTMPLMFNPNIAESLRNSAIDLGLRIVEYVNLNDVDVDEHNRILTIIKDVYLKVISDARDQNHRYWSELWIFIIKFTNTKLRTSLTLLNKLLRIVEHAFRNTNIPDQRLKAYNCWRELIDNLSLSMDHLCSRKQLTLIITPLKVNISRSPEVIVERFNTFLYLMGKLQDKSVLCLKEFLEFCVGPFQNTVVNLNRNRKNQLIYDLPWRITIILITIIGHQHDDDDGICVESKDLMLGKPTINPENFKEFDGLLINSVLESCLLISNWKHDQQENAMKCMWRSLFNLIANSPVDIHERCYTQINNILTTLNQKKDENSYYCKLLNIISGVAVNYKITQDQLLRTLFEIVLNLACYNTANITNNMIKFISGFDNCINNSELQTCLLEYYLSDTVLINFDLFCECWLKIIDFPIDLSYENRLKILNWCVIHLEKFKNREDVCSNWIKYYHKYFKSAREQYLVLQNIEKLFLNNPLLHSNVIQILVSICLNGNVTYRESNVKFLTIIESILSFPTLPNHSLQTVVEIISTYFDKNHHIYQLEDNNILSTLCNCVTHVTTVHKEFSILSNLQEFLGSVDKDLLKIFSNNLASFIETLLLHDDDQVTTQATKLSQLLEVNANITTTTDTFRISTMSDNSLNNKQKISHTGSSDNNNKEMKVFGSKKSSKDAPLTRGSRMVARALQQQQQQQKDINDESSSDFVKIDSDVKFELNKLSEHQKEIYKKRRDDIPALYQDLSQSQTQDVESNDAVIKTDVNSSVDLQEDRLHKNVTVRNKRKSVGVEENPVNITENNDTITDQNNSNIDNNVVVDGPLVEESLTMAILKTSNPPTVDPVNKQKKKPKRAYQKIRPLSIRDYLNKRKRRRTPVKAINTPNQQQQQNKSDDQQSVENNNDSVESQFENVSSLDLDDPSVSSGDVENKAKNQTNQVNVGKRTLRQRRPPILFNNSAWYLDEMKDNQKIVEKKRLRKQKFSTLSDDYTWCVDDLTASVGNGKKQQERGNIVKTVVNGVENQSSDLENSLSDFKPATTVSRRDRMKIDNEEKNLRIKIDKQLLNKSIDSIDFRVNKKQRKQTKRKVNSLENGQIDIAESQDIIESSQEATTLDSKRVNSTPTNTNEQNDNEGIDEIQMKETQLADTETCNGEIQSLTSNPQLDLQQDDNLTKSDIEMCLMSTATLTSSSTAEQNLPTSPITCDTPDRTLEFMNDTSDISPINSTNINNNTDDNNKRLIKYVGGDRSMKMLQLANSTPPPSSSSKRSHEHIIKNRFRMSRIMSPSMNLKRFKKPSTMKDENLEVLTFTRNITNHNQVPGSSILKRKIQSDEFLPNPKRKRVNFSDPAITSEKIIIQHPHEFTGATTADGNTSEMFNEDLEIISEVHDYMALVVGRASDKGLDRHQIGALIQSYLKDNDIEFDEFPTKSSLINQLKQLTNVEAANLLNDYFETINPNDMDEIKTKIIETNKNHEQVIEKFLLELSDDNSGGLNLSKKFHESIGTLSNDNDTDNDVHVDEIIKKKVCKWKTDKCIDLLQAFNNQLDNDERNKFLIDLMKFCSDNLTDPKFIDNHFEIAQNFVKKFVSM